MPWAPAAEKPEAMPSQVRDRRPTATRSYQTRHGSQLAGWLDIYTILTRSACLQTALDGCRRVVVVCRPTSVLFDDCFCKRPGRRPSLYLRPCCLCPGVRDKQDKPRQRGRQDQMMMGARPTPIIHAPTIRPTVASHSSRLDIWSGTDTRASLLHLASGRQSNLNQAIASSERQRQAGSSMFPLVAPGSRASYDAQQVHGSSCRRQTCLASRVRRWSLLCCCSPKTGALYNLNLTSTWLSLCLVAQGVPGPCAASGNKLPRPRVCKHAGIMLLPLVRRPWTHVGLTCALCGMRRRHACLASEHGRLPGSQTASLFQDVDQDFVCCSLP